jgi:molybdopterin-containing oxidoreductase family iron-sulfur binding subunit
MERREFLRTCGVLSGSAGVAGLPLVTGCGRGDARRPSPLAGRKWGMVIDLNRCSEGCTACVDACRRENNVAFFGDARYDVHWIRKVRAREKGGDESTEKSVILLCNHCEKPPCAQVCPVKATYKREDGIVIVDHHRCIGCRYCMIACPYNARFFNFKENPDWPNPDYPKRSHGVTESCTFCSHLLDQGKRPACVEACEKTGASAIRVGDLNVPDSEVSVLVATRPVKRLREDLGTEPKVYYIGL